MSNYKEVKNCRVCGSEKLRKYLDLGEVPLANALDDDSTANGRHTFPIQVLFCDDCSLSQLSIVVNPEIVFRNYPYHSSVSETFRKHCEKMAKTIKKILDSNLRFCFDVSRRAKFSTDHIVVDIGSNDGCLLEEFKRIGYYTIGVEPAKNLALEAQRKGLSVIDEFWSEEMIGRVPACSVITATNVLAHTDDVKTFLRLVGLPFKCRQLHLKILFESCGIPIFKVEQHDIHGGSLRVYASPYPYKQDRSVKKLEKFEVEHKLYDFKTYKNYSHKIGDAKIDFYLFIKSLRSNGKKVIGYGASAKGISLINYCDLNVNDISFIVDDTPQKQSKYAPGSRIPIVDPDWFELAKPDYIVLLAWNFAKELIRNLKDYNLNGVKYIVPIPKVKIL